jgi:hypothetical protein
MQPIKQRNSEQLTESLIAVVSALRQPDRWLASTSPYSSSQMHRFVACQNVPTIYKEYGGFKAGDVRAGVVLRAAEGSVQAVMGVGGQVSGGERVVITVMVKVAVEWEIWGEKG